MYPISETLIEYEPTGTLILKFPSTSVAPPIFSNSITRIFTPTRVSLVEASITFPVSNPVCA